MTTENVRRASLSLLQEFELPPNLEKFIEYSVSEEFSSKLSQFYTNNCTPGMWENWDMNGEQTLDQYGCYQRYNQLVDAELESFCARSGFNSAELASQMAECKAIEQHDFLPAFLQNMEYYAFCSQMKAQAVEIALMLQAKAASASATTTGVADYSAEPINLTGVWKAHGAYQSQVEGGDSENLENFLIALGCPWFARKILKHASYFVQNITIMQDEAGVSFNYKMLFFGTTSLSVQWGVECERPNLWKKMITTKSEIDSAQNMIVSTLSNESYFKGTGHFRYLRRMNRPDGPGDMMVLTDLLQGVSDNAGGTRDMTFSQYFIRE